MPKPLISGSFDCFLWNLLVWRFQFLQADNVRLRFFQPPEQDRQAPNVAIDIISNDFHAEASLVPVETPEGALGNIQYFDFMFAHSDGVAH